MSALFFIVGGQGLLALGTQYLSSGAAALINSTIPIWLAIFVLIFFRKVPTRLSSAGISAGFIGLIILVLPTLQEAYSELVITTDGMFISKYNLALIALMSRFHPVNYLTSKISPRIDSIEEGRKRCDMF